MRDNDLDVIEMFEVSPGRFIPLQEALDAHEAAHKAAQEKFEGKFNPAADLSINSVLAFFLLTLEE